MSNFSMTGAELRTLRAKPGPHDYAVGDVLVSSWGYDQTNIDYYQVTAVIGARMLELREIGQEAISTGRDQGRCIPLIDNPSVNRRHEVTSC